MKITEVRIYPVHEKKVKAYASIVFDNCFIVKDLKVIHSSNKLFVAMPSKKMKDGKFRDTVHPLNTETRKMIEGAIIKAYEDEIKKHKQNNGV